MVLAKKIDASKWYAFLPWIICALAASFYFYELCLRVALGTMVPEVQAALHISIREIGILSFAYYCAYTPMQIVAGTLLDKAGPRKLLISMVFLCSISALLFAHTDYFSLALLSQFCVGFASAFAFVGVLKLAANWLPSRYFNLIAGLTTSLGMIGAMISNIVIAYALRDIGWRGVWVLFGTLGIVLMGIIYLICMDQPVSKEPLETKTETITVLGWKDIRDDLVKMIKNGFFWINGIIGGLLYLPTTAFASLWGVPYLQTAYGFGKVNASTIICMIFLGWAIGGPIVGWISGKYITKKSLLVSGSFCAFLLMGVVLLPVAFSQTQLSIILLLLGIVSSVQILVFDVATTLFKGRSSGTAVAMTNFILMLLCGLVQPIIGFFINTDQSAHQYRLTLLILPIGLALAFIMSAFLYKEKHVQPS